jgi:hypothetical protein
MQYDQHGVREEQASATFSGASLLSYFLEWQGFQLRGFLICAHKHPQSEKPWPAQGRRRLLYPLHGILLCFVAKYNSHI